VAQCLATKFIKILRKVGQSVMGCCCPVVVVVVVIRTPTGPPSRKVFLAFPGVPRGKNIFNKFRRAEIAKHSKRVESQKSSYLCKEKLFPSVRMRIVGGFPFLFPYIFFVFFWVAGRRVELSWF